MTETVHRTVVCGLAEMERASRGNSQKRGEAQVQGEEKGFGKVAEHTP